jgi:predicted Na+-dependent transporter
MGCKERVKEEILFWKEMFSLFSKILILVISAIAVDVKTNQITGIDYLGILIAVFVFAVSVIALLKWKNRIRELEEVENGNYH